MIRVEKNAALVMTGKIVIWYIYIYRGIGEKGRGELLARMVVISPGVHEVPTSAPLDQQGIDFVRHGVHGNMNGHICLLLQAGKLLGYIRLGIAS